MRGCQLRFGLKLGRDVLPNNGAAEFVTNNQILKMVGAVGIEPTTSPV
jgi:hypothetical protein